MHNVQNSLTELFVRVRIFRKKVKKIMVLDEGQRHGKHPLREFALFDFIYKPNDCRWGEKKIRKQLKICENSSKESHSLASMDRCLFKRNTKNIWALCKWKNKENSRGENVRVSSSVLQVNPYHLALYASLSLFSSLARVSWNNTIRENLDFVESNLHANTLDYRKVNPDWKEGMLEG